MVINVARRGVEALALDTTGIYDSLDPSGLRDRLRTFPDQCEEAWYQTRGLQLPDSWKNIDKVVIGGMGGSAIAGDLVKDLASLQTTLPVTVIRDFQLPFPLDDRTLFIACSFSGNTPETLSLLHQARQTGARVMTIAGGGALAEGIDSRGIPCLLVKTGGEPRSALGYNLTLLLGTLQNLRLVRTKYQDVAGAIASLRQTATRLAEEVPTERNQAKQLACDLRQQTLVVYGGGIFSATARRWKTQLNENGKAWAFYEELPELLHNSVESFQRSSATGAGAMVVVLEPDHLTPELESRYRTIGDLLQWGDVPHRLVKSDAGSPLSQILNMVLLGDYVSYYLGLLYGMNPSDTPAIDRGKRLVSEYTGE
ncbi:MAG: bifunctional phosphoglucose/phosphomannose isomerase [Dehalococcoidia bacterium]